jgi:hypothetical protein
VAKILFLTDDISLALLTGELFEIEKTVIYRLLKKDRAKAPSHREVSKLYCRDRRPRLSDSAKI